MYHHTEHREPPGVCAQSIALLPAHTQLWGQILYKSHLKICWWYSCGRTHHRQWWGRLQRGGGAVSEVVRGQQPVSKCPEDETDRPGLQVWGWLPFTLHHRLCGGEHQRQKKNPLVSTLLSISDGLWTLLTRLGKHRRGYTSSRGWSGWGFPFPSSPPSIKTLWRASWHAEQPPGTSATVLRIEKPHNVWQGWLWRSSGKMALCKGP